MRTVIDSGERLHVYMEQPWTVTEVTTDLLDAKEKINKRSLITCCFSIPILDLLGVFSDWDNLKAELGVVVEQSLLVLS